MSASDPITAIANLLTVVGEAYVESQRNAKWQKIADTQDLIITLKEQINEAITSGRDGNLNAVNTLRERLSVQAQLLDNLSGKATDNSAKDANSNG